tara:strand:- start:5313 stop:7124 length:1812 start_codon:yes stop_codon:yes gene_type:complete
MASIIGKADSTLVNSAYKVALSQIPADMSGVYSDMLQTVKDFDKEFIEQTNTLFSGINSANEEMLELIAPIDKMLTNGTFSDQDMMTYKTVLDGFRNEYKLIPKGKQGEEARLIWTNKVNRFKNNVSTFNKDFVSLTSNIAGENYIPGSLDGIGGRDGDTNIKFLNSILRNKNGAEGNKAKMTVDANGNTFFEANIDGENVKMSLEEIKDMLPLKDATSISGVDRVLNKYKKLGGTKDSTYDASGFSNDIFKIIESSGVPRNAFQTLAHYDYGQGSFYQDLNSPNGVLSKTLTQALAGVTFSAEAKQKFDKDGKEGITAGDFTYNNGENRRELIKYIMGNDKVGRKLLSNWYASTVGQTSFNEGKVLISQQGTDDYNVFGLYKGKVYGGTEVPGSGTYVENKTRNDRRNEVKQIYLGNTKKDFFTGEFGQYNWKGNDTWELEGEDGIETYNTFEVMDREQLYSSTGEFEKGLSAGSDDNVSGGKLKLTEDNITRINNIWSDRMKEKPSVIALNKILKDLGTNKRVYEDDSASAYGLRFDNETFNIKIQGDKQRLINVINQHLSTLRKTNIETNIETKSEVEKKTDELLNKYGGFNFDKTMSFD